MPYAKKFRIMAISLNRDLTRRVLGFEYDDLVYAGGAGEASNSNPVTPTPPYTWWIGDTFVSPVGQVPLDVPTQYLAGDLMLAVISLLGTTPVTITEPAGWNVEYEATSGHQSIYWRFATASEPASYTWNLSETFERRNCVMFLLRNVPQGSDPTHAQAVQSGTGTVFTAPQITVSQRCRVYTVWSCSGNSSMGALPGVDEYDDSSHYSPQGGPRVKIQSHGVYETGQVGPFQYTHGTTETWRVITLAVYESFGPG